MKSLALVLIGCIVALLSAWKGFTAFGSYPGHGRSWRHWRQRLDAVEEQRRKLDTVTLPELEAARAGLGSLREDCRNELARLQGTRAAADQAKLTYETRLAQLRSAKDAAVMQYREANLKVRTAMPPAYFAQLAMLPEVDFAEELPEHRRLTALIEDVERQLVQMPALVEAKLEEQISVLRGLDLFEQIEAVKARASTEGQAEAEREARDLPLPPARSGAQDAGRQAP